jgi:transglutaminase-like putative cysteine protease
VALAALAGLLALARRPAGGATPGPVSPAGAGARRFPAVRRPVVRPAGRPGITLGPDRPARLPGFARSGTALVVVVAAAVLAGGGGSTVLPAGPPVDPRAYRSTPAVQADGLDPLSALAGWTAHPDESLFTARLTGEPAGPVPLRLAVLADFDGAAWTSAARYTRAGRVVPDDARPGTAGPPVTQQLTVTGLTGRLLPALDRPAQLGPAGGPAIGSATTDGYAVDLADGLLLRTAALARGDRFSLVSTPAPARSVDQLAALTAGTPATAVTDAEYLALPPDIPPVLRALAQVAAGQGVGPFQRAALLERYLATNFQFDPTVPPGHTLAHVEHFVADTRRGTAEQFATTFVLAARILGLPSRVVVGFVPTAAGGPDPATVTVTGRQALAWAEVRFDGAGWLPFFPTPAAADSRGATLAGTQGESAAQAAAVDAAVRGGLAAPVTAPTRPVAAPARPGRAAALGPLVAPAAAAVTALAAAYLALAFGRPAARRRRLLAARGQPRARVVLAWAHALDALGAAGVPVPASASPADVVLLGADAVGGERADGRRPGAAGQGAGLSALRGLAALATLALFGPGAAAQEHPDRGGAWAGGGGERAAAEARRLAVDVERASWRTLPRRRRLAVRLAPRRVLGRT